MADNPKSGGGFKLGQELSQRLELKLSPQMIQSMEILQLTVMDLQAMVKQELEMNPTLETVEAEKKPKEETSDEQNQTSSESALDILDRNRDASSGSGGGSKASLMSDKKWEALQSVAAKSSSIQDYLLRQFNIMGAAKADTQIAENIIYNVDNAGYLKVSVEDIANDTASDVSKVSEILDIIQNFDPPGVASRDLHECLINQISENDPDFEIKKTLIRNHLEDVKMNRIPQIASSLGMDLEDCKCIVEDVMSLNPRPGSSFSREIVPDIVPDVIVEEVDGEYEIKLNSDYIPRLKISQYYHKMLGNPATPAKTKEYIKKKMEAANMIIRAIRLRQDTLVRIVREIMKHQEEFFEKGLEYLKPLKMEEIAKKVGVHTTTVSRAVSAQQYRNVKKTDEDTSQHVRTYKYIQTPRGILSMKFFFSRSAATESQDTQSNRVVLNQIKELVSKEDKQKPFSDEEIIKLLKEKGINIARRTVAKYRKELSIPSSQLRRQH